MPGADPRVDGALSRRPPGARPSRGLIIAGALAAAVVAVAVVLTVWDSSDGSSVVHVGGAASAEQEGGAAARGSGSAAAPAAPGPLPPSSRTAQSSRAVVWAVGDGADGKEPARRLARLIVRRSPDRFLYLGDVYERGTFREFREHYQTVYGRLVKRTAPTPGNHDWPNHATGYDRYWRRALGRRLPDHYSFRLAGWQIISLNSQAGFRPGSAQLRWLQGQLTGEGTCRLAFWHSPRYSPGTSHGDRRDLAPLWDPLVGKAVLVVNGHSHNSMQLKPIDGITTLIAGSGGHRPIHGINRNDARLAWGDRRYVAGLRLVLRRGRASFAFITSSGRTLRRGSVSCRTA